MRKGWSIDPADWNGLNHAVSAASTWYSVLLTPTDQHMVPERPGIYAICVSPPVTPSTSDTMFHHLASPIYVGRSRSSIRARFISHCNTQDPVWLQAKRCYQNVPLSFWFMELPSARVRDLEAHLIDCFGPPINRRRETISATLAPPVDA